MIWEFSLNYSMSHGLENRTDSPPPSKQWVEWKAACDQNIGLVRSLRGRPMSLWPMAWKPQKNSPQRGNHLHQVVARSAPLRSEGFGSKPGVWWRRARSPHFAQSPIAGRRSGGLAASLFSECAVRRATHVVVGLPRPKQISRTSQKGGKRSQTSAETTSSADAAKVLFRMRAKVSNWRVGNRRQRRAIGC
jgi:hypothetical protein